MAKRVVKKKAKARASVEVMIRRYKAKLVKLARLKALKDIKQKVAEMQSELKEK